MTTTTPSEPTTSRYTPVSGSGSAMRFRASTGLSLALEGIKSTDAKKRKHAASALERIRGAK